MGAISITAANVASVCIECCLFGIFLVLSTTSLVLLIRRRIEEHGTPLRVSSTRRVERRWLATVRISLRSPLIVANAILMMTVSAHWALGVHRLFIAIVYRNGGQAATDFFKNLRDETEVARLALFFVDILVADAVIIYRTWLIWSRNIWVISFPICSIATLFAFGIGLLHQFSVFNSDSSVFAAAVGRWIVGYCAATLCTNVYCTAMIAYRIWSINKVVRNSGALCGHRDLYSAMAIFVQSAAMCSAWATMFVVLYATKSSLQTLGSGCGPTVIGIAFMMITVRVGLGWDQDSKPVSIETRSRARQAFRMGENDHPLRTFTFNITRTVVEQETDHSIGGSGGVGKPASDSDDLYISPTY